MVRRLRKKLTYSNVVSTLCLFVVLGGGAYAAGHLGKNSVASKQIKNGSVTGKDVKDDSLTGADVNESTLQISGLKGPRGEQGKPGTPGDDGEDGTARAYATVNPASCTGSPSTCVATAAKGVDSVTHPQTGVYCVSVPGVSSSDVSAAVSVDFSSTSGPEGNTSAMSFAGACSGSAFGVETERLPNVDVEATPNDAVGFTIVIP